MKNYKSIEGCSVELSPLTLLVGPNGAGKSNFIDGLRITSDAVNSTLESAIRDRGGVNEVRRRSRGHPTHFGIKLELELGLGLSATYAYQVAARKNLTLEVQREECRIYFPGDTRPSAFFVANEGEVDWSLEDVKPPPVARNSLALPVLSAIPVFQVVFEALSNIGFYNLNLDLVRALQPSDMGNLLARDGKNLAAVIRQTGERAPKILERVEEYLAAVVPGIRSVGARALGPMETIEFRQEVEGDENPWRYLASSVSDGTLRALGILTAVFQVGSNPRGIPLVAIEEPEVAIHPGAALRLMDALVEASRSRQIILTTHSPDLLDHPGVRVESVLAVQSQRGTSRLGPVGDSTRQAVSENLYTVGELVRLEQVRPDVFAANRPWAQLRLFSA